MKKLNPFCLVVLYCLCCFVLTATADDGGIQVLMGEATTFIQGGPTIVNPVTIPCTLWTWVDIVLGNINRLRSGMQGDADPN